MLLRMHSCPDTKNGTSSLQDAGRRQLFTTFSDNVLMYVCDLQVCQEECVGVVLDFLRSTETCRNDPEVVAIADLLENIVCSFENGIGDPESSCLFYDLEDDADRFIGATIESCLSWWIFGPSDSCPALLPFINTTTTCQEILMQTYDEVSCCYVTYVRSEDIVNNITA